MDFLEDEDEDYLSSLVTNNRRNVSRKVDDYMEAIRKLPENFRANTGAFWLKYENEWPELASYAKRVLTVPASSAAVERVFSVVVLFYVHLDDACLIVFSRCLCF